MSHRREFLKQGGAGLVGAAAAGWAGSARAADEELNVALIGCGGRGLGLFKEFSSLKGVKLTYLCDPDSLRVGSGLALARLVGQAPQGVADLREVLDDKSVDAVVIATPDHWHAPAAILACDAGKHVYVEKPCCHNIREGQVLREAARRSGKVVQHGTQSRSNALVSFAIKQLHEGIIGDVIVARAYNIQRRREIGREQPGKAPEHLDYDLWLGPAPKVPYQANQSHYNWHWWYDFGTGDMGNDGVHELDIARWGLGVETHPSRIAAIGGKYVFDDDQQFPDTQNVLFEYPTQGEGKRARQLQFEMRIWSPYQPDGFENGNVFYGTDGWMKLAKKGVVQVFDKGGKLRPLEGAAKPSSGHARDFVDAIREGRAPAADIASGVLSASLCHLGNIATRLGRTLQFDPTSEQVIDDPEGARLLKRAYREGHWAVPSEV